MSRIDRYRLMVRVARLYHERNMRQPDIAQQLGISQATVSRLLNQAKEEGITRITVNIPPGVNSDIEEKLVERYGLRDAIVVDSAVEDDYRFIERELGAAAAYYLESALRPTEVVGISSWSATLLALVNALNPVKKNSGVRVLQILGGVGNPSAEIHANRLTGRFADLVKGTATYLPAPGIVGSAAALKVILDDPYIQEATRMFDEVTTALVGIGSIEPSKLLAQSGNIFSQTELDMLRQKGAVGDILIHFFDRNGKQVDSDLNNRVVSMSLEQLRRVDRSIGIAGGKRKYDAILGALRGKWINILITDSQTATRLV